MDWVANNLYWTDTLGRRLEVHNLDSQHTITLLQSDAHSAPKAIVVDPSTRYYGDAICLVILWNSSKYTFLP